MLKIGIIGGGPSALFIYKRIVENAKPGLEVVIFEKGDRPGAGMPYSKEGANDEHITNVSGNEIPDLVIPVADWVRSVPKDTLDKFNIDANRFNEYKTLPRLLFGQYLTDQFKLLQQQGRDKGIATEMRFNTEVEDVIDDPGSAKVRVEVANKRPAEFDRVVICTGHLWPKQHEGRVRGYFDSPYPPSKLAFSANHAVAIRGSSLTAIDAIRTLARYNGDFSYENEKLVYQAKEGSPDFRIVMHSRNGLLPALRFHLEDSHLGKQTILSPEDIRYVRDENGGFLPLDYIFDKNFKEGLAKHDPEFYELVRDMNLEEFVSMIMEKREKTDAFVLLSREYAEAEKSIRNRESIYWKEMLGVLSFTMNYPAKYFPAEDMLRLQRVLMPLISVVIAYVPQSSAKELLAMHQAGKLSIIAVGENNEIEPQDGGGIIYRYQDEGKEARADYYPTFVDCIGQPHLSYEEIPFKSLLSGRAVSPAKLYFKNEEAGFKEINEGNEKVRRDRDGKLYLLVPGITINDSFQAVDEYNALNERLYIMAVPFIGGYNPDYSGLDFGEEASRSIIKALLKN
ncbi:FAD/NAD(P)-binding protein [Mucilaginibacter endophyticus]|uniref:FAD/NAD(P)-binding protein n=1 Tax=Mucilaginibacter endophyticus TaxID=2675003 RepID=UPI000E0DF69A|nr:FAD/NAD(P)-binding protein [Mucilaginibacter endophyticus]